MKRAHPKRRRPVKHGGARHVTIGKRNLGAPDRPGASARRWCKLPWVGRSRPVLRAVITFTVLMGLFYGFVHTPAVQDDPFMGYLSALAALTGQILALLGYEMTVVGNTIASDAFAMEIVRGCDAVEPTAAFIAAVLASPVVFWMKIPGLLLGAAALMLINMVRIISLFFIGIHIPGVFDMMHEELWQATFIVLAIVLWAVWVQWATRGRMGGIRASG